MIDPVLIVISVVVGTVIGWLLVNALMRVSRRFRMGVRRVGCKCGFHQASGHFESAIGGRDVMRCDYCDHIVYEVQRSRESLRRVK